jgi:tetratricopeptide (TPR) repeat protein
VGTQTGGHGSARHRFEVAMLNKANSKRKLTRKEQRDLDIEIGFMEGVVQRDPRCADAWKVLSEDYARRSKFDEGLKAGEHLARIQPDDPSVLYDLACCYSIARQIDQSIGALSQAIAKGFDDFKWMLKDPDLGNLRKDPAFKKIWGKLTTVKTKVG